MINSSNKADTKEPIKLKTTIDAKDTSSTPNKIEAVESIIPNAKVDPEEENREDPEKAAKLLLYWRDRALQYEAFLPDESGVLCETTLKVPVGSYQPDISDDFTHIQN